MTHEQELLQSAIAILKEDPRAEMNPRKKILIINRRTGRPINDPMTIEGDVKVLQEGIDNTPTEPVQSGFSIFQPGNNATTLEDSKMSRKNKQAPTDDAGLDITVPEGYTEVDFAEKTKEPTKQELKAAATKAKIEAKAAKAEAAAAAKAAKLEARAAALAAKQSVTKEEREARHAARMARLAELGEGKKYAGPMLALADRVKQGVYVKGSTGQLRAADELATVLDAVPVDNVIRLAKEVLEVPENPYTALNTGQQSMNFRNRMRGALKKGTITIAQIQAVIDENGYATATDWMAIKAEKAAIRAAHAAEAKAAKEAKAALKAAAQEPAVA